MSPRPYWRFPTRPYFVPKVPNFNLSDGPQVSEEDKFSTLQGLISQEEGKVLVLAETKETVNWIGYKLDALTMHGGREQAEREDALDEFKGGFASSLSSSSSSSFFSITSSPSLP